jgi:hypothetical protein
MTDRQFTRSPERWRNRGLDSNNVVAACSAFECPILGAVRASSL